MLKENGELYLILFFPHLPHQPISKFCRLCSKTCAESACLFPSELFHSSLATLPTPSLGPDSQLVSASPYSSPSDLFNVQIGSHGPISFLKTWQWLPPTLRIKCKLFIQLRRAALPRPQPVSLIFFAFFLSLVFIMEKFEHM